MNRSGKKRAVAHRRLLESDVVKIVRIIHRWPATSRITWNAIVAKVDQVFDYKWTRQTLESRAEIKDAYERKKRRSLRTRLPVRGSETTQSQEAIAGQVNERLRMEIEELRTTLRSYDERFVRYIANAYRLGITAEQLEADIIPLSN